MSFVFCCGMVFLSGFLVFGVVEVVVQEESLIGLQVECFVCEVWVVVMKSVGGVSWL